VQRGRAAAVLAAALALAGCNTDGQPVASAAAPRGATIAFESIDGPPPDVFRKLVQNLNDEAQSRHLAVISREGEAVYRVRGYLAAHTLRGHTTVSWLWDVYDGQNRALRIGGDEAARGKTRDAWAAADDAMIARIAQTSMTRLAAFLTAPEAAAPAVAAEPTAPTPGNIALAAAQN
jgi:hypothetical protein